MRSQADLPSLIFFRLRALACGIALGLCRLAQAADAPGDLLNLDLTQLGELPVVSASRHEQSASTAPAVVTVLDGEDLRLHGYRSVAEALADVPGLFVVYDGIGYYVTVRGFSTGERSYGRSLKVMIDGQPIGTRTTDTQQLGPDLLPMGLIERIEVVKGPASALYGANAFLGVVNIITRADPPALRVQAGVGHAQASGGGVSGALEAESAAGKGPWQLVAAASGGRDNRSGTRIPASSPAYGLFADPVNHHDLSRPQSAYSRLRYETDTQSHQLMLHASRLDSDGEFLEANPLGQSVRVIVEQQTVGWLSNWSTAEGQRFQFRAAHAWGGPGSDMRQVSPAGGPLAPNLAYGYRSDELGLEAQLVHGDHHLVLGADGSWDHESAIDVFSLAADGSTTLLAPPGTPRLFRNAGFYAQYQWLPEAGWSPSLNWRHDKNDRYGKHDSYRFGVSRQLLPGLDLKLLTGTSFQAPNNYELYGQPAYAGDVLGNPQLLTENSTSTDLQVMWKVRENLLLVLNAYHMNTRRLIELEPFGVNQHWTNLGEEKGDGVNGELRWQSGAHQVRLWSALERANEAINLPVTPTVTVPTDSAPRLVDGAEYTYRLDTREIGLQGRYVSSRRASDSNIGLVPYGAYALPAYTLCRLHAVQRLGEHRLTLSVDNLFNRHYAEPGYGGIDLPGQLRTVWLSWSWEAGS